MHGTRKTVAIDGGGERNGQLSGIHVHKRPYYISSTSSQVREKTRNMAVCGDSSSTSVGVGPALPFFYRKPRGVTNGDADDK